MHPESIFKFCKTQKEAAKKLGYCEANISKWFKKGRISEAGQLRIKKYLDNQAEPSRSSQ